MMIDLRPRLLPALVAGLGVSLLIGAIHLMSSDLPDMPREAGLDTHVSVSLLEVRLLELEREREREIDRQGRRPIRPKRHPRLQVPDRVGVRLDRRRPGAVIHLPA